MRNVAAAPATAAMAAPLKSKSRRFMTEILLRVVLPNLAATGKSKAGDGGLCKRTFHTGSALLADGMERSVVCAAHGGASRAICREP
jgi:hypothetical protein